MRTLLGLALLLTPAFGLAATLSSTAMYVDPTSGADCSFTNVSTRPLDVTVTFLDDNAAVLTTVLFSAVAPGNGNGLGLNGLFSGHARCAVSYAGSTKFVRAALELTVKGSGVIRATLPVQ